MKKHFKKFWFALGVFALLYSLNNDIAYFLNLISVIVCIISIPLLIILFRNVRVSKFLFGYRFLWLYPLIVLFSLSLYLSMKLFLSGTPMEETQLLIMTVLGLFIGVVWGFTEWNHITSLNDLDELSEYVEWVDDKLETKQKGVLSLTAVKHIVFRVEGDKIIEISKEDIAKIFVRKDYLIFPLSLSITLKDGSNYLFESEFPYVWQKELAA